MRDPATPRGLNEPIAVSREETVPTVRGSDRERSQGVRAFARGHVAIERAKTCCGSEAHSAASRIGS